MPYDINGWYLAMPKPLPDKPPRSFKTGLKDALYIYLVVLLAFGVIWVEAGQYSYNTTIKEIERVGYPIPIIEVALSNTIPYYYGWDQKAMFYYANTLATGQFNREDNLSKGQLAVNFSKPSNLTTGGLNVTSNIILGK